MQECIDEVVVFFGGSTQTSQSQVSAALFFYIMHPEKSKRVLDELKQTFGAKVHIDAPIEDWVEAFTESYLTNLIETQYFMSETLRLHPSIPLSLSFRLSETSDVCDYSIRKGTVLQVDMHSMQTNPEEWIDPWMFNPERFNPESPYFKTPSGKKRHPMSFSPFLGGRRVCVGKTFSEYFTKIIFTVVVLSFQMEFEKEEHYKDKPAMGFFSESPKVPIKIKVLENN